VRASACMCMCCVNIASISLIEFHVCMCVSVLADCFDLFDMISCIHTYRGVHACWNARFCMLASIYLTEFEDQTDIVLT
jgi:hypothetical protein